MKQLIILAIVLSTFTACNGVAGWFGENSDSTQVTSVDNVAVMPLRDRSITAANAYSDLFLDSAAVEAFINKENLNDTVARSIRGFYHARNYQYAWFASDGFTEQGRGFWNLYSETKDSSEKKTGINSNRNLEHRLDMLLEKDTLSVAVSDSAIIQTELQLTQQFIHYAKNNLNTKTPFYYLIPTRKIDPLQLADSILNKQKDSTQYAGNRAYTLLKQQLAVYYNAAKNGGWQPITAVDIKQLKKGTSSPTVTAIKKRLQLTKDYIATDTSSQFNDSLEAAIKTYQQRNGFQPSGIITDSLIQVMNVPAQDRIQQLLVNMNRMLWMPAQNETNSIQVNIPSFMLYVYEGNNKVFDMPVVVGKEGSNTMMFSGYLNQVVFSPYWNIPQSIVKDEIMPAIKNDPNYLKKRNMEIVGKNDSLPEIRQLPGKDNDLGKVKFLFPNSYDIYFHDTPAKEIFKSNNRAMSHGCIRLADSEKMAQYLLRDQKDWTPEKIKQAMSSDKEQKVVVTKPTQVLITYYTAWVDDAGQLHFRNDIYKHDKNTANKMFINQQNI